MGSEKFLSKNFFVVVLVLLLIFEFVDNLMLTNYCGIGWQTTDNSAANLVFELLSPLDGVCSVEENFKRVLLENTSKLEVANNRFIGDRPSISGREHKLPKVQTHGKGRDNGGRDIEGDKKGAEGLGDDLECNF